MVTEHFFLKCMSLALEMEFILVCKMGTPISFPQFIWKFDVSDVFLTVERDFISIVVDIIPLDIGDWVNIPVIF